MEGRGPAVGRRRHNWHLAGAEIGDTAKLEVRAIPVVRCKMQTVPVEDARPFCPVRSSSGPLWGRGSILLVVTMRARHAHATRTTRVKGMPRRGRHD